MHRKSCRPPAARSAIACLVVLGGALFMQWPSMAAAHAPDQGYIFIRLQESSAVGRVELMITDLNAALGLGLPEDGSVEQAEIDRHRALIEDYLSSHVAITADGPAAPLTLDSLGLHSLPPGQYLVGNFSFPGLSTRPEFFDARYEILFDERPSHRGFLVIEHDWETGTYNEEANVVLIFSPDNRQQRYNVEGSVLQGFMAMVGQGVHHIWIGIDHILFLVALLLPSVVHRRHGRWEAVKDFRSALIYVIKVVTVFTVAHTVTLSAAALGAISLPSRLVESIIALSIAIAAFDVIRNVFGRRIWVVVFVFGLFHGFGFASVLGDIGIGGDYLLYTLLAFNVGVELGQIAIVALVFPVLFLLRDMQVYRQVGMPAGAVVLIVISLYWFVERGFAIDLPAGAIAQSIFKLLG